MKAHATHLHARIPRTSVRRADYGGSRQTRRRPARYRRRTDTTVRRYDHAHAQRRSPTPPASTPVRREYGHPHPGVAHPAPATGTASRLAGGLRERLGHAASGAVSTIARSGADGTDIADTTGHTVSELAARAGMAAAGITANGVGHAAGAARNVMTRDKRAAVDALRAARKKAKRAAGTSGRHAGVPSVLSDAKPSARIGARAAEGRASRMIGNRIGRRVHRLGSTGMGWADEAGARLVAADDDLASRVGNSTRDLAFKAARKGVSGVTSSARFIWRHRAAPVKAARGVKATGRVGVRVIRAAAGIVRAAAVRVAAGLTSISLPILPVIAVMVAVLALLMAVMGAFMASGASASAEVRGVPAEYEADVIRAGSICELITPPVIAAQIEAESGWDPDAASPAGAVGIAQFMPSTWTSRGMDGDGDGVADINDPHDQIWSQGNYMCSLAAQVESAKTAGTISGDSLQLTLAAYNAGFGNVTAYGGVPPFAETTGYVSGILIAIARYTASGGGGTTAGTLDVPLVMQSDGYHVDIAAMGIPATDTTYQVFQCTWWASVRRASIGRPVDGYMGNGGDWNDTALRLGYPVSSTPQPGDVICFEPGVHGSDPYYGHVGVVEIVNPDGSILISQSGRGWMSVVTETISAGEIAAMGSGVSFIH